MSDQIQVVAPYWDSGTWVFDDLAPGLVKEPFLACIPGMIDDEQVGSIALLD